MTNPFGDLAGWVADVIDRLGYVGVAVLVALENVFPPIPSEIILPLSGFLAGQGRFSLPVVVLAATLGSVVGALILYAVGHVFGEDRIRRLVRRHGRWFGVAEKDIDRADAWFDRHGTAVVFFGRLVPVIRSLVSIPAGVGRMALAPFLLYTALGSALWNTALIGAGWLLGDNWEEAGPFVEIFQYLVLAAVAVALLWFLSRRLFGRQRRDPVT